MHPCQDSLEHLKRSVYISIVPKFQVVYIKKLDLCPIKSLVVKLRKSLKFCNSVKQLNLILIMRNSISNAARPGLVKALRWSLISLRFHCFHCSKAKVFDEPHKSWLDDSQSEVVEGLHTTPKDFDIFTCYHNRHMVFVKQWLKLAQAQTVQYSPRLL